MFQDLIDVLLLQLRVGFEDLGVGMRSRRLQSDRDTRRTRSRLASSLWGRKSSLVTM